MKKPILRMGRLAVCTCLLFGALTSGHAQKREMQDKPFKVAQELRELVNKSTTPSREPLTGKLQKANLVQLKGNYVVIEAVSNNADGRVLLKQLQALGLKKGASFGRMVSGLFPVDQIDQLEQVETLRYAVPSYEPMHNVGLVTSQGDVSLGADIARTNSAVTGVGSRVGVLSDSYGSIPGGPAAGVASGDLPNDVAVLEDAGPGFSDEGRAMAEIVHDVAPGAKIAFNTAFLGQASFANGIQRLADNGCNIIVDDVFYFAEPYFQDGIIAQSVDQAVARNVSYFSAAGNRARASYESAFRNSGQSIIIGGTNYGVAHDFGGGDTRQTITVNGQLRLGLQWVDPFFSVSGGAGAQTNLDILVFVNGNLLFSARTNNLGADPVEILALNGSGTIEISITKVAGPDPSLMKYIDFGNSTISEFNTTGSTVVGHNNAAKTISVGAAPWFNTPQFNPALTSPVVEPFSSLGGTPVFITTTGVNTGNDPSKIRRNPSVVGPDGGNNTFFGSDSGQDADAFPNFFGTSAAAPHVAAVAALMQQAAGNTLTPQNVKDLLTNSALDMDDPFTTGFDTGYDLRTGFGFVRAGQAVAAALCLNDVTPPTVVAQNVSVTLVNGTATVTAAQVDNGSTDNCGIASRSLSRTTFGCADLANSPISVTLTVTDNSGNVSTGTALVTVLGSIPVPSIAVAPSTSVYTGGIPTNLYLGYGPQSVTLTASGGVSYVWSPATGLSNATIANPVFSATAAGTFTYTVTATSASGCTATKSVTLTVLDVRCGNKNDKVLLCHNGNSLCISPNAVNEHLASHPGDRLGGCPGLSARSSDLVASLGSANELAVYPNPAGDEAMVSFRPLLDGKAQVMVYNGLGQRVASLYEGEVTGGQLYAYPLHSQHLATGLYVCHLVVNGKTEMQRLIIAR